MTLALYTFADEGYVPAIAAMVNSARRNGFSGPIHIGSPEPLSISKQALEGIVFHSLGPSEYWPGNRKTELLLKYPSEHFAFLDADTVITDPTFLARLEGWLESGPVVAVEHLISSSDYRRHRWAKRLGRPTRPQHWPSHYFNAGLFACEFERDRTLIEEWHALIRSTLAAPGAPFTDIDFPCSDQDILNALLQDREPQPIGIGPPDVWSAAAQHHPFLRMGTFPSNAVLHCTGFDKSWKLSKPPLRPPHLYDIVWYDLVIRNPGPIKAKISLSASLRDWFEQGKLTRVISFAQTIKDRLFG